MRPPAQKRPPSALDRIDEISGALSGRRPMVFLDYDGTLTPIVDRPEDAILSDDMRRRVGALAERTAVAVVSGRDLADVRRLVGLDGIIYAGSHGFDIEGPGGLRLRHPRGAELIPEIESAERELRTSTGEIPGVIVERKRFTVAVHFRLVARSRVPAVKAAVEHACALHPSLRRSAGKEVLELRPDVEWHKGAAVLWLLRELVREGPQSLPIFIGDDVTDEDAFRAISEAGLGIVVLEAPRETAARYSLAHPGEVGPFIEALTGILAAGTGDVSA